MSRAPTGRTQGTIGFRVPLARREAYRALPDDTRARLIAEWNASIDAASTARKSARKAKIENS